MTFHTLTESAVLATISFFLSFQSLCSLSHYPARLQLTKKKEESYRSHASNTHTSVHICEVTCIFFSTSVHTLTDTHTHANP